MLRVRRNASKIGLKGMIHMAPRLISFHIHYFSLLVSSWYFYTNPLCRSGFRPQATTIILIVYLEVHEY